MTDRLLEKVKQNLILEHSEDDALLEQYTRNACNYRAGSYYACEPFLRKQRWLNGGILC